MDDGNFSQTEIIEVYLLDSSQYAIAISIKFGLKNLRELRHL